MNKIDWDKVTIKETPFLKYTVDEHGIIVSETPKLVEEVYAYVCKELIAKDPEPEKGRWYGIIDEYFHDSSWPKRSKWPLDANWIAVFAVTGGSEGHYIHVEAVWQPKGDDRDGRRRLLFLGKTFLGLDHAIECVKVLSHILEV